jgi:hypothetical protein
MYHNIKMSLIICYIALFCIISDCAGEICTLFRVENPNGISWKILRKEGVGGVRRMRYYNLNMFCLLNNTPSSYA